MRHKMHSVTADEAALRHDLRNGPRHYFGVHDKCNSAFCKQISQESTGKNYIICCSKLLPIIGQSPLYKLPPDFLRDIETAGDRLVAKAAHLIQNKTTNITENFMSIRCKVDGGKFYNRIQSGSFQHRSMAAALWVQYGPGWTTSVLSSLGIQSSICDKFTNRRKRKHDKDSARKTPLKYKKQRLMTQYGQPTLNSSPDTSYGSDPAKPDVSADELKRLCQEHLARLQLGNNLY